jgi:hypothetical protein
MEVGRICGALDGEATAFRSRTLADAATPYVWLDATHVRVRDAGPVARIALLVATGVASPASAGTRARREQRRGLRLATLRALPRRASAPPFQWASRGEGVAERHHPLQLGAQVDKPTRRLMLLLRPSRRSYQRRTARDGDLATVHPAGRWAAEVRSLSES